MATQPNRTPREVLDFPANQPVTVALKYAQGKPVQSQYGERVLFTLVDGRVMFLAPPVAEQIAALGIPAGERFTITKRWNGEKGSPISWELARIPGEQPNGTLVLPSGGTNRNASTPELRASTPTQLVQEANELIEAYVHLRDHAVNAYQGRIKPAEIRMLLVTAYGQRAKQLPAA